MKCIDDIKEIGTEFIDGKMETIASVTPSEIISYVREQDSIKMISYKKVGDNYSRKELFSFEQGDLGYAEFQARARLIDSEF